MIAFRTKSDFALIDYRDINIDYISCHFVEEETVPKDSIVISKTWKYCNKNGSRDMRFSNNYEIPVVQYGELLLKSHSGLNEAYMFSNNEAAKEFALIFSKYKSILESIKNN